MRYALKRGNDLVEDVGWNSKSDAETWIQEHIKLFGGLDWRVGGLFKARNDNPLEVVYSKSMKSVPWVSVEASK